MPHTINKIQRSFSRSANSYDRFSSLHRGIADRLLAGLALEFRGSTLLDVGCGTGYLTGKLKERFAESKVIGLDFAEGMLNVARLGHENITWILADGHKIPLADDSIEIVVSNLAYQWADNLSLAFSEARRVLVSKGILTATLFGYHTCQELFQSLDRAKNGALQIARLPREAQIKEALLTSGYKDLKLVTEQIKIEFKDMHELISWLKAIGANNLSREGYLGPEALLKAAAIYREEYSYLNGVYATFEVIHLYAQK